VGEVRTSRGDRLREISVVEDDEPGQSDGLSLNVAGKS